MATDHDAHGDDDHGHHDDDHGHDDHADHPVEDPKWVLLPLLVGCIVAAVLIVAVGGLDPDAVAFHEVF